MRFVDEVERKKGKGKGGKVDDLQKLEVERVGGGDQISLLQLGSIVVCGFVEVVWI